MGYFDSSQCHLDKDAVRICVIGAGALGSSVTMVGQMITRYLSY